MNSFGAVCVGTVCTSEESLSMITLRGYRYVRPLLLLLVMMFVGCSGAETPAPVEDVEATDLNVTVRMLVVDDPELAEVIDRQWQARAANKLEVTQAKSEDIRGKRSLDADVVIYPAGMLGELAEFNLISPIPSSTLESAELARADLLKLARIEEVTWGEDVYAISFGSPQFCLLYRRDLFRQLNLKPPTTWAEYQQLAEVLSDRSALGDAAPPEGKPWRGTIEPLASGWAGQMMLARAAAYARDPSRYSALFDFSTLEPEIASEPFVRALKELAITNAGSNEAELFTPATALQSFMSGESAMAICWPTAAMEPVESPPTAEFGMAPLPGSEQVFHARTGTWRSKEDRSLYRVPLLGVAGRYGSIVRGTRRARAAGKTLAILTSQEWSTDISTKSPAATLFRTSHLGQTEAWLPASLASAADDYVETIAENQHARVLLFSPRIPGRNEYLAALDEAVQAVLSEQEAPPAALAQVDKKWRAITEQYGSKEQRNAYKRSLGLR